jgi:hypothetical protein
MLMATDLTDASRDTPAFRRIEECSIDELYCALDDLGLDMDRILRLNLTLHQVSEIYIGLLRWQLMKMDLQLKLVATLR